VSFVLSVTVKSAFASFARPDPSIRSAGERRNATRSYGAFCVQLYQVVEIIYLIFRCLGPLIVLEHASYASVEIDFKTTFYMLTMFPPVQHSHDWELHDHYQSRKRARENFHLRLQLLEPRRVKAQHLTGNGFQQFRILTCLTCRNNFSHEIIHKTRPCIAATKSRWDPLV